jgi:hypothetical protein
VKFAYDEQKLAELLLYVAKRLEGDPAGGATKLNKALFFAEFAHVRSHGRPITGAEYQKLDYGPAPRRLLPVRDALISSGAATLKEDVYLGYSQKRLVPLREPDLALFSADELEVVDQAIEQLKGRSGTEASDLSHEDMGWRMVEDGETIPFTAAYLRLPVLSELIRRRAAELAANRRA